MKSYNANNLRLLFFLLLGAALIYSCKNKSGDEVTFNLSPVTVGFSNEPTIDSVNIIDSFYTDTIAVNNDFYRSALTNNNVFSDDVTQVTITGCAIDVISPTGFDFSNYKSISVVLNQPGYLSPLLIAQSNQPLSGNTISFDLKNNGNLLPFFKLQNLPVLLLTAQNNPLAPLTELKLTLNFSVTGVNH